MTPDPRLPDAQAIPIEDVADRLGVANLRRTGTEFEGPCPVCGGRDRFAINPRRRVFNCRICNQGGDGIALVRFVKGCSFPDALSWLVGERDIEISVEERVRRAQAAADARAKQDAIAEQERERARRDGYIIWTHAVPAEGSIVEDYLRLRGIEMHNGWPRCLRFLPDHPYVKSIGGKLVTLHRGPAMIACITRADGKFGAAHQTWIDLSKPKGKAVIEHDGQKLASKMVRGSKKGGAIRLTTPPGATTMVMGEGIETTATAMLAAALPGPVAYWAGVDLGNMSGRMARIPGTRWSGYPDPEDECAFVPPPGFTDLWLLKDGDSSAKMTEAKLMSCIRRAQLHRPDLRGHIVSAGTGRDLNDLITPEGEAGK